MNKKVLLFLSQGFEEYEASVFTDVICWSRVYGTTPVDLITTGLRRQIKGTWNMIVKPELDFERINVEDFDNNKVFILNNFSADSSIKAGLDCPAL